MMRLPAITALGVLAATGAFAESFSHERFAAIHVAFEMHSEVQPDRILPAQMAGMKAAYSSHDPAPHVDGMTATRWRAMQAAYTTHDPVQEILASID